MNPFDDPIVRLHATLSMRDTPETIAKIIREAMPGERKLARLLDQVIKGSIAHRYGWSSMSDRFHGPVAIGPRIEKARELATLFLSGELPEADDAASLDAFIVEFAALIGKQPGENSFKTDRLARAKRAELGLELSRRRYVKLFRLAGRLERKLNALRRAEARHRLVLVGKAALAPELEASDFAGHLPAAAFVAYYTARMKLRSEFTNQSQQRPFDELAAALLERCLRDDATPWRALAHVFPREDVLNRLGDSEKGRLLGRWHDVLSELAERLEQAYRETDIDLDTMIVKRGNDSSTWNILAGAWNRARDHWIAYVSALGLDPLFDTMLPGKVMRMMAADVAYWHRQSGGGLHPDTRVWIRLPKPWAVLRGEAECTRETIASACQAEGLDPEKSGWTAPRPRRAVAVARPTPELVHGVSVGNPYLAGLLRDLRVYSGKPVKQSLLARLLGN